MKTSCKEIVEEIAPDLQQFLRRGNLKPFALQEEPNLNIDNIEKLLRIHFVLTKAKNDDDDIGVIDFIEKLPIRIRRVKTTIKQEPIQLNGEVRSRIRWNDTIRLRSKNGCTDIQYVCDQIEKNYNITENLILKSLISIIQNIIENDLSYAFQNDYCWIKDWVNEDTDLRDSLNILCYFNVYLKRIDLKNVKITEKMLNRGLHSRIPLYKEAAKLHIRYNRLLKYELDKEEAIKLLEQTFIQPDREEELYELYWTLKIIKQFNNPQLQLIEPHNNIIAQWYDNGFTYKIYHNSIGSGGILDYKEDIDNLIESFKDQDNFVGRNLKVIIELRKMIKDQKQWINKRPDIVLEKYDSKNEIKSILVCEVKYTDDRNYAIVGLRQLLEYIALAKKNKESIEYYEKLDSLFDKMVLIKGCLFLDRVENLDITHNNVLIIKYTEDQETLKTFLINAC